MPDRPIHYEISPDGAVSTTADEVLNSQQGKEQLAAVRKIREAKEAMTDDRVQRLRDPASAPSWADADKQRCEAADEIDRLKQQLRYQEARDGIQTTHAEGCYAWGPSHYECALREVERLRAESERQARNIEMWSGQVDRQADELTTLRAERDALRLFAGRILHEHREHMADVDGFAVQEYALEARLLESFQATEPCGEGCECIGIADFPTDCLRYSAAGRAAIDALAQQAKESE